VDQGQYEETRSRLHCRQPLPRTPHGTPAQSSAVVKARQGQIHPMAAAGIRTVESPGSRLDSRRGFEVIVLVDRLQSVLFSLALICRGRRSSAGLAAGLVYPSGGDRRFRPCREARPVALASCGQILQFNLRNSFCTRATFAIIKPTPSSRSARRILPISQAGFKSSPSKIMRLTRRSRASTPSPTLFLWH